jgi:hypothetical protein
MHQPYNLELYWHSQERGDLDHPIAFVRRNLSESEQNYNTAKREGLAMVYALQKFRHYLLGNHFNMLTGHSTLKIPSQQSRVGGHNMSMVTIVSRI